MSQQRRHTQTFTQGINQRIPPERTDGLLKTQNARLTKFGETAQVSRINGFNELRTGITAGKVTSTFIDGNVLFVVIDTDPNYTIEIINLDTGVRKNIFSGIAADSPLTIVNEGDTYYLHQAGRFIYKQEDNYYLSNAIPAATQTVSKLVRVDAADDLVNITNNAIQPIVIMNVESDSSNINQTVSVSWYDNNKRRGLDGEDLGGGENSLDRIIVLEYETGTGTSKQTIVSSYNDPADQGTVDFNVVLDSFNVRYPVKVTIYPRFYPTIANQPYQGTSLIAYGTPELDVRAEVLVDDPATCTIDVMFTGVSYITNDVILEAVITDVLNNTTEYTLAPVTRPTAPPPVFKIRLGYDKMLFARPFGYSYRISDVPRGPKDKIFSVQASVELPGFSAPVFTATDSTTITIPGNGIAGPPEILVPIQ